MLEKDDGSRNNTVMGWVLLSLTYLWLLGTAVVAQFNNWLVPALGVPLLGFEITAAQGLTNAVIVLLLALIIPDQGARSVFRAWFAGAAVLFVLSITRMFSSAQGQATLLAQLVVVSLALIIVWVTISKWRQENRAVAIVTGLCLALLIAFSWLFIGEFGSLVDIVLAIAVGWMTALLVVRLTPEHEQDRVYGWTAVIRRGMALSGLITLVASGLSLNGVALMLIAVVAPLGWLAAFTERSTATIGAPAVALIGAVTAFMLALIDSDGMVLLAADVAILFAFGAAAASTAVTIVLVAIVIPVPFSTVPPPILWGFAVILLIIGGVIYAVAGQPGLHGDRLFVILDDQLELTDLPTDYDQRRLEAYARLVAHADTEQADLRRLFDRLNVDYQPYYLINAIEVDGGVLMRLYLASRSDVDRVLPSPVMRPLPFAPDFSSPASPAPLAPEWNLTMINADLVWHELGVRGAGIVIGQSDSGVQWDHPELSAQYRGAIDGHDYHWFDPWTDTPAPVDLSGHGTHTLGSVLGTNVGVAPDATWFGCANLLRNLGNPALYLDCMQFMLAPFPLDGDPLRDGDPLLAAHVINNSWGCPQNEEGCDPNALAPAVDALRAAGIFVVASAGNDGPNCSTVDSPIALYDSSFTVGAVDRTGRLTGFSSVGPVTADGSDRLKPDIVAPGASVNSAIPNDGFAVFSGTSMAGPHVVGVVALMWSANPALIGDIDRTEQIIRDTATPVTGGPAFGESCLTDSEIESLPNNAVGYGLINAYEAVQAALAE